MRTRFRFGSVLTALLLLGACATGTRQQNAAAQREALLQRWRSGHSTALLDWARSQPGQAWSAFDLLLRDLLEPLAAAELGERRSIASALARFWQDQGHARPQAWLAEVERLSSAERARRRRWWQRLDFVLGARDFRRLESLAAQARASSDQRAELEALRQLATSAHIAGDVEKLAQWTAAGRSLASDYGTPLCRADFLRLSSWLRYWDDDLRGARQVARQALQIDGSLRALEGLVRDHYALACYCDDLGLLEEAADHLKRMRGFALASGHRTGSVVALADEGLLYRRIGDLDRARALLRQAWSQIGALPQERNRSILLDRLAQVEQEAERWSGARTWMLLALELERRAKRPGELADIEAGLALIAAQLGETQTSRRYQAWALKHVEERHMPSEVAGTLLQVAQAQARLGDHLQARSLLRRAEQSLVEDAEPLLTREIIYRRGQVELACGEPRVAEAHFARAAQLAESSWRLAGAADLKTAVLANVQEIYGAWIERLAARHQAEQSLVVSERGRARLFLEQLARARPSASELARPVSAPIAAVGELIDALPQNGMLVVFRCDPRVTWRWAVSSRGVTLHRINLPLKDLQRLVAGVQQDQLVGRRVEQLSHLLWSGLEQQLAGTQRLIVVPDGPLLNLGFAALQVGGRALVARCALTHAPSATAWVQWRHAAPPASDRNVLVVGDPLGDLPGARAEACAVAKCFPAARLLLGSQANPAALLAELPRASLVHLAAHYQLEPSNPYRSQLMLARADGRGRAPLSMETLGRESLAARPLIVLSSCAAASGRFHPGEGVVGGFRALFEAGARGVIAPLQAVEDLATARLMRDLAVQLDFGREPDQALALAQRAALSRNAGRGALDWASFIFIGGAG